MIIIDSRMRNFEKEKLKELGYELYEISPNPNLYFEISSHPDIHCININGKIISDSHIKLTNSILGKTTLQKNYPLDIAYNVCLIKDIAIHNFKYTEPEIIKLLDKFNFKKINIKQGYSKCSIATIGENSVIVTDYKIAETLNTYNIEVLLLSEEITKNIHLFKNSQYEYSSMTGFIGGVISKIDDFIFISGDLKLIDKNNLIRNFIEKNNLKIIDFPGYDIIDYGGLIQIK